MKNLFVPYEIAKKLKELGFNEGCLSTYTWNGISTTYDTLTCISENPQTIKERLNSNNDKYTCSAPLWQQVVDWFREKHNIEITVYSVNARKYAYSFEFMEAWDKKDKDYSLTLVDQVIYKEKKGVKTLSVKEFEEMKLSYREALEKAIEEGLKLI